MKGLTVSPFSAWSTRSSEVSACGNLRWLARGSANGDETGALWLAQLNTNTDNAININNAYGRISALT